MTAHQVTYPDDRPLSDSTNARIHQGLDNRISYRKRYQRKDGSPVWANVTISAIRDNEGHWVRSITTIEDITEYKEADDALRESELRFRAFFENSAVGASQVDAQGRFLQVNDRYCEITGYSREELLKKTVFDLSLPEDIARDRAYFADFFRGRSSEYQVEKRYVRKDGSIIWVQTVSGFIPDANGKPCCSAAITEDITARKRAEEELRRSELFYRQTLESIPGMVFTTRPDGYCDYQSQQWVEFTGVPMSEQLGDGWANLLHPEDRPAAFAAWRAAVEEKAPYDLEYRVRRRDGAYEWFKVRAEPIRDETERIVRWFGVLANIEALKQAEEALRKSEATLNAVLDALPLGLVIAEANGRLVRINKGNIALWGMPPAETASWEEYKNWVGYRPETHERIKPEEWALARALRGEVVTNDLVEIEQFGTKQQRFALLNAAPVRDAAGEIIAGVVVQLDVTERRRAEEQLKAAQISAERAKAEAERANAAKDEFLAVLSHELRTPLAPVLAGISLIARKRCANCNLQNELDVIQRNIQLEARLIDDLLDLTRIERGKISLERKPVYLCTVLERVADICRADIEARRLHFDLRIEDGPHRVHGDISRLQQIFWNLLNNAVKFTPDGGRIQIHSRKDDSRVIIDVSDTGIGVEPDAAKRIFSAFEQASGRVTRQFGGLGLGLAITKRLVEMHYGIISVRSEGSGRGATFQVVLPMLEGDDVAPEAKPASLTAPLAARRILLVEDHADTALLMKELLEVSGYHVETAANAAQSLEAVEQRSFDLLISDIGLPDKSGLELIRELRHRGNRLKGIALSGYGREDDVRRSLESGFSAHFTKPVDLDALIAAVQELTHL